MNQKLLKLNFFIFLFFIGLNCFGQITLKEPEFSIESGFYDKDISLVCNCEEPGSEIRYTRNGSIPKNNSLLYTVPLVLSSRAGDPNTISNISTGDDYNTPDEVFKGHVISAKCFKAGFTESKTKANTYFIGPDIKKRYATLAVISVIGDEGNFFDNDTGIYVLGVNENVSNLDAFGNFGQRGMEWERKIHFEFWESSNDLLAISRDLGVRIHGGATRNKPQKGLRFYARDEYGKKELDYPLFGKEGPDSFKRFILRAGGNDNVTMVRDAYNQQLFTNTGVETQLHKPSVLFLNGEFWGYHGIREAYNKHYFDSYYTIDKDNIDYISEAPSDIVPGGIIADEGDLVKLDALINYINNNDMTSEAAYTFLENEVNILSLSTLYIAQMFLGNQDWPGNNVKLWRPKDNARKWEWCLVDTDISGAGNIDVDDFGLDIPPGEGSYTEPIILGMLMNTKFRNFFINRWADLLNTRLLASNTGVKLENLRQKVQPVIAEQSARWQGFPGSLSEWTAGMNNHKDWMNDRLDVVWDELVDYYTITKANITLNVSNAAHGSIQCNSIPATELTGFPWNGSYFQEIPITLKAVNKPGFQFVEWTGGVTSTNAEITASVTDGMNITAVFAPLNQTITINELLASNSSSTADSEGEFDDWIELYNTTNTVVDLTGYSILNDDLNITKWVFPSGTLINPNSYLMIWADNDLTQMDLHASFKLKKAGGKLVLANNAGTIIDEQTFLKQTKDISWGRFENGIGSFNFMKPSFAAENKILLSNQQSSVKLNDFVVYPNPVSGLLSIARQNDNADKVTIFNALGSLIYESPIGNVREIQVDVSNWKAGIYYVRMADGVKKVIVE